MTVTVVCYMQKYSYEMYTQWQYLGLFKFFSVYVTAFLPPPPGGRRGPSASACWRHWFLCVEDRAIYTSSHSPTNLSVLWSEIRRVDGSVCTHTYTSPRLLHQTVVLESANFILSFNLPPDPCCRGNKKWLPCCMSRELSDAIVYSWGRYCSCAWYSWCCETWKCTHTWSNGQKWCKHQWAWYNQGSFHSVTLGLPCWFIRG